LATKEEIRDALTRNIDIRTRKAVKMRTRAGMGFCQGKFCGPRVDEIIEKIKG
jgi:glycerol-3-phosphate dehydrogenase